MKLVTSWPDKGPKTNIILESFNRVRNVNQFLLENQDIKEGHKLYSELSLNEALEDDNFMFLFENGMKIPNLKSRVNGNLSMNGIFNRSSNADEFILEMKRFSNDMLNYELSESDVNNLRKEYITHVNY